MGAATLALQGIGLAGQTGLGIYDVYRAEQDARDLNALAEEGRQVLRPLGTTMRDVGLLTGSAAYGQNQMDLNKYLANAGQNLRSFGSSYFGQGTGLGSQTGGYGQGPASQMAAQVFNSLLKDYGVENVQELTPEQQQQFQAQLQEQMGPGFELGQSGASQFARQEGANYRNQIASDEAARGSKYEAGLDADKAKFNSEYDFLKGQYQTEYDDLFAKMEQDMADVKTRVNDTESWMMGERDEALDEIKNDTAYTVASISSGAAGELANLKTSLQQKYAGQDLGDPAVKARYDAELRSLERGIKTNVTQQSNQVMATYSNMAADKALTSMAEIGNVMASNTKAITDLAGQQGYNASVAFDAYTSGMNGLYNNWTDANLGIEELRLNSQSLTANLLANADANVYGSILNGFGQDAQVMAGLTSAWNSLESQGHSESVANTAAWEASVNSAWANWGNAEQLYAQSLINAQIEFVPWSTPFANLTDSANAWRQTRSGEKQAEEAGSNWYDNIGLNLGANYTV